MTIRVITLLACTFGGCPLSSSEQGSPAPDFSSLEPFVRGLAAVTPEVRIYRIEAKSIPVHFHSKPFVIVWTDNGTVGERKTDSAAISRSFVEGQIDFYPAGTTHSLQADKRRLTFTMVELRKAAQASLVITRDIPERCENVTKFPEGGFACLIRVASNQQITLPETGVSSVFVAIDSGKFRETTLEVSGKHSTERVEVTIFPVTKNTTCSTRDRSRSD